MQGWIALIFYCGTQINFCHLDTFKDIQVFPPKHMSKLAMRTPIGANGCIWVHMGKCAHAWIQMLDRGEHSRLASKPASKLASKRSKHSKQAQQSVE